MEVSHQKPSNKSSKVISLKKLLLEVWSQVSKITAVQIIFSDISRRIVFLLSKQLTSNKRPRISTSIWDHSVHCQAPLFFLNIPSILTINFSPTIPTFYSWATKVNYLISPNVILDLLKPCPKLYASFLNVPILYQIELAFLTSTCVNHIYCVFKTHI